MKYPIATQLPIEVLASLPGYGRCFDPSSVLYPGPPQIEGLPEFCGIHVSVHYYVTYADRAALKSAGSLAKVLSAGVRRMHPAAFNKWVNAFAPFRGKRRLTTMMYVPSLCKKALNPNILDIV